MTTSRTPEDPAHRDLVALLPYYELGALSDDRRMAFERHVLECDLCFGELVRGAAVASALRERRDDCLAALVADRAAGRRPPGLRRFRLRLLVPLAAGTAMAALALSVLIGQGTDIRKLASFPTPEIESDRTRSPAAGDVVAELLDYGAAAFNLGRYEEAARYFGAARDRAPEHADASYYLGLAMAHAGDISGAVNALEHALVGASDERRPEVTWALANAYLAQGRLEETRRVLRDLSRGTGREAGDARELLQRITE